MLAMEAGEHIGFLELEGQLLGEAAASAGLDASVPGCPGWAVRDLVGHISYVHRWAAAIVGGALTSPSAEVPSSPADDELVDWYRAGHAALVATLRAAPTELECFAFLPAPSPLAFWARRQAMETAIHRADAEGAGGSVTPYDETLARDGIDELLVGFGARKKAFVPGTIRLEPAEAPTWSISLTGEGLRPQTPAAEGNADVTVSGSSSDIFRWLWNRPADVTITGDDAVAKQWEKVAIRWS